ncbi:MAG: hypothetical protein DRR06_19875 [Gammaproteobacteria bacterium]|nr:MAG: hypothetical protein DRR06_19875 [Gammaproteobacteria bacterium]
MAITSHFYHETLRKYVVAFGTLFNGLTVVREDGQIIDVPIAYGSKQKWMALLQTKPDLNKPQAYNLPRMSFIITNLMYDTERKTSSIGQMWVTDPTDNTVAKRVFHPVPYNIDFALTIYSKNMADYLQIFEQILPFFKPAFKITIEDINDMSVLQDVPIIMNDTAIIHDHEGAADEFRVINSDLNFTVKGAMYGPLQSRKLITKVVIDFRVGLTKFDDPDAIPETRITTVPDPETAFAHDDYGFTQEWENFPTDPPV